MTFIFWILPDALVPYVVGGVVLLALFRVIRWTTALVILVALVVVPIVGPYVMPPLIELAFDVLPVWFIAAVGVWLAVTLLRQFLAAFLGRGAADHVMGALAMHALHGVVALGLIPVRLMTAVVKALIALAREVARREPRTEVR